MSKGVISFIFLFFLSLILWLGLGGSVNPQAIAPTPQLTFEVSGCDHSGVEGWSSAESKGQVRERTILGQVGNVNINIKPQTVLFSHTIQYVCCAEINLESEVRGNVITITETNEGDFCRCVCEYSIKASLGDLAEGTYQLRVYGVGYAEYNLTPNLLFERQVQI